MRALSQCQLPEWSIVCDSGQAAPTPSLRDVLSVHEHLTFRQPGPRTLFAVWADSNNFLGGLTTEKDVAETANLRLLCRFRLYPGSAP